MALPGAMNHSSIPFHHEYDFNWIEELRKKRTGTTSDQCRPVVFDFARMWRCIRWPAIRHR
ncbi:hypothetical protein BN2476_600025 [Paraburkholderia piptadeniae]|uniref:Uncharacterized protein n=1 Tax=Paraburkholderia piptadeniae TaxID=1701573 RepID=A0A1N7SKA3_9BURK|nr:hypothetical protein BN2476_600025 [Paraburkholderia piptadeniae]